MKLLCGAILSVLLGVFAVSAQTPQPSRTPTAKNGDDDGIFDPAPALIRLNVSVWSKNKGYLKDLKYTDFEIFDGKDKQPIEFFLQKDEPISIGILFDTSESIQSFRGAKISEIPFAVEGLVGFINKSNPKNEYFITTFSKRIVELLEPTQDRQKLAAALKTLVVTKTEGNTRVYDAIGEGLEKLAKTKFATKILFVISDGIDNNSKKNVDALFKQSRQAGNVRIYFINLVTESERPYTDDALEGGFLAGLAEESGGRTLYSVNFDEVKSVFQMLADEIAAQYVIGFTPKNASPDKKKWHEVKINVKLPPEKLKETGKVSIHSQKGFYF